MYIYLKMDVHGTFINHNKEKPDIKSIFNIYHSSVTLNTAETAGVPEKDPITNETI